jgi:PAS domain S-box-containing protein
MTVEDPAEHPTVSRAATTPIAHDSAALLKAAVEDAADHAFIVLDAYGAIQRWNGGAAALFGYTPAAILGRHFSTLFTIEDIRAGIPETELRKAAREGSAEDARWHVRADGTRFFANGVTVRVKDSHGDLTGFVKLARDGTARQRAEDERERLLVREQQLNREKDTFFAAVSHELRTPLTALSGWIALIDRASGDPAVVAEGLTNMKHSVEMLTKLVNDLLDTVRARSAKMEIAQKRIELGPIVFGAVQAFRQQWETKGLALDHTLADGLFVMGDPTRLHQIVWNLVTNAIKHTPAGGSIGLALRAEDGNGVIEVRDSGDGIDAAFLPYIFEPFRQQTGDGEGLGLGLAIARSLVEAHGGTIAAESAGVGKGATFRVRLPLESSRG